MAANQRSAVQQQQQQQEQEQEKRYDFGAAWAARKLQYTFGKGKEEDDFDAAIKESNALLRAEADAKRQQAKTKRGVVPSSEMAPFEAEAVAEIAAMHTLGPGAPNMFPTTALLAHLQVAASRFMMCAPDELETWPFVVRIADIIMKEAPAEHCASLPDPPASIGALRAWLARVLTNQSAKPTGELQTLLFVFTNSTAVIVQALQSTKFPGATMTHKVWVLLELLRITCRLMCGVPRRVLVDAFSRSDAPGVANMAFSLLVSMTDTGIVNLLPKLRARFVTFRREVDITQLLVNIRSMALSIVDQCLSDPSVSTRMALLLLALNRSQTNGAALLTAPLLEDQLVMFQVECTGTSCAAHPTIALSPADIAVVIRLRLLDLTCCVQTSDASAGLIGPASLLNELQPFLAGVVTDIDAVYCSITARCRVSQLYAELFQRPETAAKRNVELAAVIMLACSSAFSLANARMQSLAAQYIHLLIAIDPLKWIPVAFRHLSTMVHTGPGKLPRICTDDLRADNGWAMPPPNHASFDFAKLFFRMAAASLAMHIQRFMLPLDVTPAANDKPGIPPELLGNMGATLVKDESDTLPELLASIATTLATAICLPVTIAARYLLPEMQEVRAESRRLGDIISAADGNITRVKAALRSLADLASGITLITAGALRGIAATLADTRDVFTANTDAMSLVISIEDLVQTELRSTIAASAEEVLPMLMNDELIASKCSAMDTYVTAFLRKAISEPIIKNSIHLCRVFFDFEARVSCALPTMMRLSCGKSLHAIDTSLVPVFCKHHQIFLRDTADNVRLSAQNREVRALTRAAMFFNPTLFLSRLVPELYSPSAVTVERTLMCLHSFLRLAARDERMGPSCTATPLHVVNWRDSGVSFADAVSDDTKEELLDGILHAMEMAFTSRARQHQQLLQIEAAHPVSANARDARATALKDAWYFGLDADALGIAGKEAEFRQWLFATVPDTTLPPVRPVYATSAPNISAVQSLYLPESTLPLYCYVESTRLIKAALFAFGSLVRVGCVSPAILKRAATADGAAVLSDFLASCAPGLAGVQRHFPVRAAVEYAKAGMSPVLRDMMDELNKLTSAIVNGVVCNQEDFIVVPREVSLFM